MSNEALPVVGAAGTPDTIVLPIPEAGDSVRLTNWRGYRLQITVDGKNVGNRSGAKITLSNGETAQLKIKAFLPGAPRVLLDGIEIFTTPQPPVWLVVLAALPALSLVALQGVVGLVIALGGVFAASAVVTRAPLSTSLRALAVVGVIVAAWTIALLLASLAA